MSLAEDRKLFFELANESGMAEDLAKFAKTFGRFQSASIELSDGRSAGYYIPQNVTMKPLSGSRNPPQHTSVVEPVKPQAPLSEYAKARRK
ncbi:hypothetical protein AB6D66_00530 [Vibrio pomeroyi]|uniref:Uncharacterized protein n=1 Tax=Vibrio pomeroyi TaxID=198832 RepID=A0ABV4MQZ2_9VIBR|nr:hypothetical protein [Vibrio atlanticus]MCZ4311035.1 hypothetical protein [Vibrio atlanticus]